MTRKDRESYIKRYRKACERYYTALHDITAPVDEFTESEHRMDAIHDMGDLFGFSFDELVSMRKGIQQQVVEELDKRQALSA